MRVEKGIEDLQTVIPIMNRVFKKNFPKLLPKLYTDNRYANDHFVCYKGDEICGCLASIPNKMFVGNEVLNLRGIGMVSTKKQYRNQGVMSAMLKKAIECSIEENVDFLYLSGLRQRYERYGFTPCCEIVEYTISNRNFNSIKPFKDYSFVKLQDRMDLLPELEKIYNKQNMRYERLEFLKTLQSWNNKRFYVILDNDKAVGYLVYKFRIEEIVLDNQHIKDVLMAYRKKVLKVGSLKVVLTPNQREHMFELSSLSEYVNITNSASFRINNYRNVLRVLLNYQAQNYNGGDYSVVVEIQDYARLKIEKKGKIVRVDDTVDKCDISIPLGQATNILFSKHLSALSGLPFCLNLFINHIDNV